MGQTPDRFPGIREDEGILLDQLDVNPASIAEMRYRRGLGYKFLDEGVTKSLGVEAVPCVSGYHDNFTTTWMTIGAAAATWELSTWIFRAYVVAPAGFTVEIRLFDQNAAAAVANSTLSSTSTIPAYVESTALTVPPGVRVYLAQLRIASGSPTVNNRAVCFSADIARLPYPASLLADFTEFTPGTPLPPGALPGVGFYSQPQGSNQTEETVQIGPDEVERWAFIENLPRIGMAPNGVPGLVLEPDHTNSFVRGLELDNGSWTPVKTTVTANASVAPDGTSTAESIVESTDVGVEQHYVYQGVTTSGARTISGWLKARTRTACAIAPNGAGIQATYDLSTATIGSVLNGTPLAQTIRGTANGWCRPSVSFTYASADNRLYSLSSTGSIQYIGSGGIATDEWGWQHEAGQIAHELVPTFGSVATSAANMAEWDARSVVHAGVLDVLIDFSPKGAASQYGSDFRLFTKSDDATTYAEVNATTRILTIVVGGTSEACAIPIGWDGPATSSCDRVQMRLRIGNGVTNVRYRISKDGGMTWGMPFDPKGGAAGTNHASIPATGTISILCDSPTPGKVLSSWLHRAEHIEVVPAWALQWLPTDESTIRAYFRPDGGIAFNGTKVSGWDGQTASAVNLTQGTSGVQPTYDASGLNGYPSVHFDSSGDWLTFVSGPGVTAARVMFGFVVDPTVVGDSLDHWLFDSQTGRFALAYNGSSGTGFTNLTSVYDNVSWRSTGYTATTGSKVLVFDLKPGTGTARLYVDGAAVGSTFNFSAIATGGASTAIGGTYAGGQYRGHMGDIMIAQPSSDAAADVLRLNFTAYAGQKFGITVV